ncbi:hypothetical protein CEXT_713011 [Caerostris extrusa]|uniref:Uncharacterized protein n=1 Tax=Caerostris extrusa TaxID=172846 RepID=A0AAV4TBY9_CAEEX|nr:hypothetical protein CEXT_713011 [Caerostris extrusa]
MCGYEGEIQFDVNHLEMPRLVAFSAALSSHPPLTTTSLNPRSSSFPTPYLPVVNFLSWSRKSQTANANLLPPKLPFPPGASVEAPTLMNHLNYANYETTF